MRINTCTNVPGVAVFFGVGNTSHGIALGPCVQHRVPSYRQNHSLSSTSRYRTLPISAASSMIAPSAQAAARSDLQQGSMEIAIQELQQLCQAALKTLGYDDQQSLTISEVHTMLIEQVHEHWMLTLFTQQFSCFAGAAICATAQQQQQYGQSDHWRSGQAVR